MEKSRVSFVFVLGLIFSVISVSKAQNLFVFGDSLYDVGNQIFLAGNVEVAATTWPYGLSLDYPSGRWSDGKTIPDFIANFLEIPSDIPPALNSSFDFTYGANFAVNGATVLGNSPRSMNFSTQVKKFTDMKSTWTDVAVSKGVHMIYIGADDYINFVKEVQSPTTQQQETKIKNVIDEIVVNLKALNNAGAKKFAVQNLAPLGCLPIIMQTYQTSNSCYSLLSSMADKHNTLLLETLKGLSKTLPEFKYSYFDYYNSILRRRDRETTYRLFSARVACCGTGPYFAFGCGLKTVHSTVCNFQRGFLFWDGRNHAEKSNQAFAKLIFSADPVVVQPSNLRELYVFPTTLSLAIELKGEDLEESSGFVPLRSLMWRGRQ